MQSATTRPTFSQSSLSLVTNLFAVAFLIIELLGYVNKHSKDDNVLSMKNAKDYIKGNNVGNLKTLNLWLTAPKGPTAVN